MRYILYGAGGHAKVILDIIFASGNTVIGFIDDFFEDTQWNGIPYLGNGQSIDTVINQYPDTHFLVAIGNNRMRKAIVQRLHHLVSWGKIIHPSAVIGSDVYIGEGTVVMPNVVINANTKIGKHSIINTAATVDHDNNLGDFVHLSPGVHTAGEVCIGNSTHVGINASIIPGITVGAHSIIGAASCILENIPDYVTAVGCPSRIIKLHSKG
ncbi:acetyltransferase [Paenibacillus sp. WLX2291]|uniref:acetyltransferase n=1 Tax=Paenibacillus sp. WLX2291 TaxID=3296934 RepID=UPI003984322D